ncbi:MAG: type II toxin-antitoxin system VapC family toxin [Candidatus Electrothrix aestuarii]|uniref:Type II toxin-antitoxin system VapC family toxin n=1 Tax=Candidatus Electrothrix aestuarii TaxID=3062594 RepID=A0AAU8LY17_9BACT|nr:type II toxin-antitoxin system VapC family toxin [Candidatus Electrothrix aestuarii]
MKPRVYIETSIPSYYHEIRDDPESAAKRLWTREWWEEHRSRFELLTAPPVLDELEQGDYPTKEDTLQFVGSLPLLPVNEEVIDIVQEYIQHHLMPNDPAGDALHLALASYYNCQFLLTWNCRHLANANKFEHIRHINTLLGLPVPILTTPFQLMQEDRDDEDRSDG